MDGWRQVLKLRATVFRYREPVVAKDDEVKYTEKDVTFQRIDEEGKLVDTKWKIPEKEYELIPADPKETADRWSYLDPETGHQPSTWATGLTLSVSSISRTSWDARWFNDLISTRKPPAYSFKSNEDFRTFALPSFLSSFLSPPVLSLAPSCKMLPCNLWNLDNLR